ncbi:MAG: aldehyde dehydrogenase family protein [Oligoflexia bacterium]|nr:aldehyde dehydrogenase family protein [Oligoflexia bacterium]
MLIIRDPATGEIIERVPADSPLEIAKKARRARAAQKEWARTPLASRREAIRRFGLLLESRQDELARVLTRETGKPITQARAEIAATQGRIAYFTHEVGEVVAEERWLEPASEGRGLEERITQEPLGVIANISAWNYPYFVGSNVFLPALLTGNAVLYKPSEHAMLTGLAIARLLHEAGIPEDVFVPVVGDGTAGATLLEQPLDGIFFTGSSETGRKVALLAARQLARVQLELGGKDPLYVREDVELAWAARAAAEGVFYNNGQSCCAVERLYVHDAIHDAFVEEFLKVVRGFRLGDPLEEATFLGPLARQEQLGVLERQVADARERGGRVVLGGKRVARRGTYFEPTVVTRADHSMELMREESFGPLIGIARVGSDEEAIERMNDTRYGLTAAVFTASEERARAILGEINAGTVYWNCCDRVSPRLPWSGRGASGMGATLSRLGIQAFLQPKSWHWKAPPQS